MLKKVVCYLLALALLGVVGCSQQKVPENLTPPPAEESTGEPPIDRTWISPGKVMVGNFYPGARAEWNLTIHNGKDTPADFAVSYRVPDYVAEGFEKAPPEAQDWVIIADPTPVLAPKETKDILVFLDMPKTAKIESKKWEFWIAVMEQTGGMVVTEMCSRWLVSMR